MPRSVSVRAGFAGVTAEQALARARDLVPLLRQHAREHDASRDLSPVVVQALHESGLLRVHQPRYWGGMELDYPVIFDIAYLLGQGDASTAWVYVNLASHHRQLAQWPLQAQEEVLGVDAAQTAASGIAFVQGVGRVVDGGLVLSGRWGFSSGVRLSGWNMLACQVKRDDVVQDWCMCLVPAADYEVIDDWHTIGLRGSASCTVRCQDVFVPRHRVLSMKAGGPPFPGLALHRNPLFAVPTSALSGNGIAAVLIGNAQAALDASIESIKSRSTSYSAAKMRDIPSVQQRIAHAAARIDAARVWLRSDCVEGAERVRAVGSLDIATRLRYRRNTALAAGWVTEATAALQQLAGANGIYDEYPIQRMFRDASAAGAHVALNAEMQLAPWGLTVLGGEVRVPTV